jgi:hypothetical protein
VLKPTPAGITQYLDLREDACVADCVWGADVRTPGELEQWLPPSPSLTTAR